MKKKLAVLLTMILVASNCLYASAAPLSGLGDAVYGEAGIDSFGEYISEEHCGEDDCHDHCCGEDDCRDYCCEEEECLHDYSGDDDGVIEEPASAEKPDDSDSGEDIEEEPEEDTAEVNSEESSETGNEQTSETADENENNPSEEEGELKDTSGDYIYSVSGSYVVINQYTGKGGAVSIPSTIAGLPVKEIGKNAFSGNSKITSVTIPSSITMVRESAFESCSALTSVTMNGSYIGAYMFMNCTALKSVTVPSQVTTFGPGAFKGCISLTTADIQAKAAIGNNAFDGCVALSTLTLSNVIKIGYGSFAGTGITSVTIPASVTTIDGQAFMGCKKLESVTINEGLTTMNAKAFYDCTALKEIVLPSTLYSFKSEVFRGCTSLSNVTIKGMIIGSQMFQECVSLTTIVIPASVQSINDNAFNGCSSLKTALFMGDTPSFFGNGVFDGTNSAFVIQYYEGKTGWTTPTWKGYKTKMVTAHEHHIVHVAKKAATCTAAGNIEYWYCDTCFTCFSDAGAVSEIAQADTVIKALGHNYQTVAGTAKAATCTTAGKNADQKCSRCKDVKTGATIAALGHNYQTVAGTAKAATCTTAGKNADQKCSRCSDVKTGATIAALGHNYQTVAGTAKTATCTQAGKNADQKCSRCSDVKTGATIAALGHNYQTVAGTAKAATCTTAGKNADQKCTRCNDVKTGTAIPKLGHNWDDGVITKQPTETSTGVKTFTCKRCKQTKTETIPSLQHVHSLTHSSAKAASCTEKGNIEYWYCSKCKCYFSDSTAKTLITKELTVKPALGHSWDSGKVTKAPTTTAEGEMTYTCKRCKQTKVEIIDRLKRSVSEIFRDVSADAWYTDAIQYVFDYGLMTGTSGDVFGTLSSVKREQVVQVLYAREGKPAVSGSSGFSDVKTGDWYNNAVIWAKNNGITSGNKDGTFGVGNNISREALAIMLYKYAQLKKIKTGKTAGASSGFSDSGKIHSYAYDAMDWAVTQGIMAGKGGNRLDPQGKATRAEFATMIMKLLK